MTEEFLDQQAPPQTYEEVLQLHPGMPADLRSQVERLADASQLPSFETDAIVAIETDPVQTHDWEHIAVNVDRRPEHKAADEAAVDELVPESANLTEGQEFALSEALHLGTAAENAVLGDGFSEPDVQAKPMVTPKEQLPERSNVLIVPKHDVGRAEEVAATSQTYMDGIASKQSAIAEIEGRFSSGEMPEGAKRAIASLKSGIEDSARLMNKRVDAVNERYDREQQRRDDFQVEPQKFTEDDFEGKLPGWRVNEERKQANNAARNLLDTSLRQDQPIEELDELVGKTIALKRSSQAYIMDTAESPVQGWDTAASVLNDEVIAAVLPNLPRDIARKLYEQRTSSLRTVIDAYTADLLGKETLWPNEAVCRLVDVMGFDTAQELVSGGRDGKAANESAERLGKLLHVEDEASANELDVRLDYYRKRMETNRGKDIDLSIAIGMVVSMGIETGLAADIVRSATGNTTGQGLSQIGLEPSHAIVSIADKVERLGVDTVRLLHDEMGTTSFHRYDVGQLEHFKRIIEHYPVTLEALRAGDTLVSFIDATDDYNGALGEIVESSRAEGVSGKSLVFEVGSMGGTHNADSIMRKYAEFLSARNVSVETLIIGGHGLPGSGGMFLGGLQLGFGPRMEKIDSEGVRAVLDRINEGGTIIVESCSQGAVNTTTGTSTTGEFARIANEGGNKNVSAFGLVKPSMLHLSPELGGAFTVTPGETVVAYVDDLGNIRQELVDDSGATIEQPQVIPIRALGSK